MRVDVICHDKPGHLPLREQTRAPHRACIDATGIVDLAGPLTYPAEQMCGSLIVLKVADMAGAWAAGDPCAAAGLFDSVPPTEWNRAVG